MTNQTTALENAKMLKFAENFANIPGAELGGGITDVDGIGIYFLTAAADCLVETLAYLKRKRVKVARTGASREPDCVRIVLEFAP